MAVFIYIFTFFVIITPSILSIYGVISGLFSSVWLAVCSLLILVMGHRLGRLISIVDAILYERRLWRRLDQHDRVMTWPELQRQLIDDRGTLVLNYRAFAEPTKYPGRVWWCGRQDVSSTDNPVNNPRCILVQLPRRYFYSPHEIEREFPKVKVVKILNPSRITPFKGIEERENV